MWTQPPYIRQWNFTRIVSNAVFFPERNKYYAVTFKYDRMPTLLESSNTNKRISLKPIVSTRRL